MFLTTRGLVLRVTAYNDADSMLTVLTDTHGKLSLRARGIRRKNSPLSAPCQLLAYSEFAVFENRGFYSINEATSIELFSGLRKDLVHLALGTYFAQVTEAVCQEDISDPAVLSLTLNCLYALSKMGLPAPLVKAVFELRCACQSGYLPELRGCIRCAEPFPDRFDIKQGVLECAGCQDTDSRGIRMPLEPGTLDAMRYICSCSDKKLFAFQIGEDSLRCLAQIAETYLMTQLEHGFSTLDFYKSLML